MDARTRRSPLSWASRRRRRRDGATDLITAIGDYIDQHNKQPKPFIWTAKAKDILEKVKRARTAVDNRHSA
jgi:hypothetical protein